eukprot:4653503-Pyramimonas_sp.AAC.2
MPGLEPHSVLPLGLVAFAEGGTLIPKHLNKYGARVAFATNAVFSVAFVRHLWTWLGLRPISRATLSKYLKGAWLALACLSHLVTPRRTSSHLVTPRHTSSHLEPAEKCGLSIRVQELWETQKLRNK